MKINEELKAVLSGLEGISKDFFEYDFKHLKITFDKKMNLLMFNVDKDLKDFCVERKDLTFSGSKKDKIDMVEILQDKEGFEYAQGRFIQEDFDSECTSVYRDYDAMNYLSYAFFAVTNKVDKDTLESSRPLPLRFYIDRVNSAICNKNPKEVYIINTDDSIIAGYLKELDISEGPFGISAYVRLEVANCCYKDQELGVRKDSRMINCLCPKTVSSLEDLGIYILDNETKQELIERSKKTLEYIAKPTHCKYDGKANIQGVFGKRTISVKEDIVLDIQAAVIAGRMDPDFFFIRPHCNKEDLIELKEDELWLLSPYVYGMGLKSKIWMEMDIKYVSPIIYSDLPFKSLEIPSNYREIILSYIQNDIPSFDSVEGKGNGKIFLLHGLPGCGKTMTAEAVADYLKVPLYNVTIGELGIDIDSVERELENINQIAARWNAVVLLDEVDVFACKRNSTDIERNALTAVFLRFLEKFNGVLFMTTNLVDNIDSAFVSRTIKLKYELINKDVFTKIWFNMIETMKKKGIEMDSSINTIIETQSPILVKKMNGRDLKNFNRICFALAKTNNSALDKTIIEKALILY